MTWDPYKDPAFDTVSSLRRDPRRNSTTTFHLAGNKGQVDWNGRPTAGQRTFHMGPGQRVVAGELRYAYLDKGSKVPKLDKSLDPAEILREYRAGLLGASTPTKDTSRAQTAPADASRPGPGGAGGLAHNPSSRVGPPPRKIVFFDGKDHHVIDAPPGHTGSVSVDKSSMNWKPPHLEHKDLAPGRFLGVVEAPGSETTKLVASKHRLMPDFTGLDAGTLAGFDPTKTTTGAWLGPRAADTLSRSHHSAQYLATRSLADSVRTYGQTVKPIGHKDYEASCHAMEGLGCWEKTQAHLSASMLVGQPSRLMTPFEHTATRLSLRRPTTASAI